MVSHGGGEFVVECLGNVRAPSRVVARIAAHAARSERRPRQSFAGYTPTRDVVRDHDGEPIDELLVVAVHDTRADESRFEAVDGEPTIADVNPGYNPAAPVVGAVYRDNFLDTDVWRTVDELRRAVARDEFPAYSFPADRLAPLDDGGEFLPHVRTRRIYLHEDTDARTDSSHMLATIPDTRLDSVRAFGYVPVEEVSK